MTSNISDYNKEIIPYENNIKINEHKKEWCCCAKI